MYKVLNFLSIGLQEEMLPYSFYVSDEELLVPVGTYLETNNGNHSIKLRFCCVTLMSLFKYVLTNLCFFNSVCGDGVDHSLSTTSCVSNSSS